MPSEARLNLQQTGSEIRDFFTIHQLMKDVRKARRRLVVLNKGMVVLLSASWEGFCEDLTAEALAILVDEAPNAAVLPIPLRRAIARELESSPHDLEIWRLAGDGWRDVLRARLSHLQDERNRRLNTPKSGNINDFFKHALGIDEMSSNWGTAQASADENASTLDGFVQLRNEIAHRGLRDSVVTKTAVKNFNSHIQKLATQTETTVEELIERSIGHCPWQAGDSQGT
jgi:HEPN superfamily RiboL-PSP-like protein